MQRLKNRNSQIPNGFTFREPSIGWDSRKVLGLHPSFTTLVNAVRSARLANPHHTAKNKLSTDLSGVENDVEAYNVKICLANGWINYLADAGGGAPPPPSLPFGNAKPLSVAANAIKSLWAGVKTLNDFLDSGEPPVAIELAEARAATCVACPKNGPGNFSAWFTKPAAAAITRQLERLKQRNISTSQDAKLNVCEVCTCPLQLKVQTPMKFIKPHLTGEMLRDLQAANSNCWIVKEQ